jgi:AraC-like DNA-binding protein
MNIQDIIETIFVKCLYSAYLTVLPSWRYCDESTDYCNLVLICEGQGVFTCENEAYIVNPGDIVYFPFGAKRTMRSNGGTLTFRSINFRYTFIFNDSSEWSMEQYDLDFKFVKSVSDKLLLTRIKHLFAQIQKYYVARQYNSAFHMRYYATELLSLLLTNNRENTSFSEQNIVDTSIKYMSDHFSKKITLSELAQISGNSISYYGKIFKKITGMTPIEYLLSIRITYAKKLLENGVSVIKTAEMCGFSTLYYFSRTFKNKENISPREYAALYKNIPPR